YGRVLAHSLRVLFTGSRALALPPGPDVAGESLQKPPQLRIFQRKVAYPAPERRLGDDRQSERRQRLLVFEQFDRLGAEPALVGERADAEVEHGKAVLPAPLQRLEQRHQPWRIGLRFLAGGDRRRDQRE